MSIEKKQDEVVEEKRKPGRPVTKVRGKRTQAQLESDRKCRERMLQMHQSRRKGLKVEEKKEEIPEPIHQLPEPDPQPDAVPNSPELEAPSKEQTPEPDIEEESSSSSDEEIIVKKRKPKKKKKKKRIIYEDSSSESEDEKPQKRKPIPPETLEKKQPELKQPKMQRQTAEPMPTFTFF